MSLALLRRKRRGEMMGQCGIDVLLAGGSSPNRSKQLGVRTLFQHVADAPARSSSSRKVWSAWRVKLTTGRSGRSSFNLRVAITPLMPGIDKSMTTTSRCSNAPRSIA